MFGNMLRAAYFFGMKSCANQRFREILDSGNNLTNLPDVCLRCANLWEAKHEEVGSDSISDLVAAVIELSEEEGELFIPEHSNRVDWPEERVDMYSAFFTGVAATSSPDPEIRQFAFSCDDAVLADVANSVSAPIFRKEEKNKKIHLMAVALAAIKDSTLKVLRQKALEVD